MLDKSIKSVEGGSAAATVLGLLVAVWAFMTGDNSNMSPEQAKIIIEAGLAKADTVQDIVDLYKVANAPKDYTKIVEMLVTLLPGTGYLVYFAEKRSELKMALIQKSVEVQNGNDKS